MGNAVFSRRPRKISTLKNLVEQAEALAIPPQKLDPISTFPAEAKDGAGPRRFIHHRLDHRRKPINATPHIGHAAGQINRHIPRKSDHAASTQATSDDSTSRSMSAAILSRRPFFRTISTSLHLDRPPLRLEPSLELSNAPMSETGMNDAISGDFNLGRENFLRHAYICCGRTSCRRATSETVPSAQNASCNIESFSSVDHRRCRSAPVRISTLAIRTLLRHK